MGLDAAELIMAVEERFAVRLPDVEMYYVRTLGDFYNVLLEQCGERKRSDCPLRKAFYRFRDVLGRVLGIEAHRVRPSTPVPPLLGTWLRRCTWRRVQAELGLCLPSLESRAGEGVFLGIAVSIRSQFRPSMRALGARMARR